jgi:hypothetical protein
VAALAAQGATAEAVALLSLSPKEKEFGYSGRARDTAGLPGKIREQPAWEQLARDWQLQIQQLIHDHVGGLAVVAPLPGACDHCHLDALCRITDHPQEPDDEAATDE